MRAIFIITPLILAGLLLWGCDDDPSSPPGGTPQPSGPDAAVAAFATALAELDTTALDDLLTADFQFFTGFHAEEAGTDSLSRAQLMIAFANMRLATLEGASCRILEARADMSTSHDWSDEGDGIGPPDSRFCTFGVDIFFDREGCDDYPVVGGLRFYVRDEASGRVMGGPSQYRICGLLDRSWDKAGKVWSEPFFGLIEMYLPAGLPHAALACDREHGTDATVFQFNAGNSMCSGLGLAQAPYRWRFGEDGTWSDWSAAPLFDHVFTETGEPVVTLEVRNTVDWISRAEVSLEVFAEWPFTQDELLASFAYWHHERDYIALLRLLSHDFRFDLMEYDVQTHDLPADHFNLAEFLGATSNVFEATRVPYNDAGSVDFQWEIAKARSGGKSEPEDPPPMHFTVPVFILVALDNADDIYVQDDIEVFGSLRDTVLADGTSHDYWIFERLTDVSIHAPYTDMSWGGLLATYR